MVKTNIPIFFTSVTSPQMEEACVITLMSFEHVSVAFTWAEWWLLGSAPKNLHQDVMLENYRNL